MHNLLKICSFLLVISHMTKGHAYSFKSAVEMISKHTLIELKREHAKSLEEFGDLKGSWGDPMFKVTAQNYPSSSLKDDESPMSGMQFSLSQKIALTNRYSKIQKSYALKAKAKNLELEDLKSELIVRLWEIAIELRRLQGHKNIYKENLEWLKKMLRVSKKLYTNGKISQQAILDLQIRKAEIESLIQSVEHDIGKNNHLFSYLVGKTQAERFSYRTTPWKILEQKRSSTIDFKELGLKRELSSQNYNLSAEKLGFVPDLTIAAMYTKRANIDGMGDFVGVSVSMPLPFSSQKYSSYSQAVALRQMSIKKLKNYQLEKNSKLQSYRQEISKIKNEIQILKTKTLKFAKSARDIVAKSYGIGGSNYFELLTSELKLQSLLVQKENLEAKRDRVVVAKKYLNGEKLYE